MVYQIDSIVDRYNFRGFVWCVVRIKVDCLDPACVVVNWSTTRKNSSKLSRALLAILRLSHSASASDQVAHDKLRSRAHNRHQHTHVRVEEGKKLIKLGVILTLSVEILSHSLAAHTHSINHAVHVRVGVCTFVSAILSHETTLRGQFY